MEEQISQPILNRRGQSALIDQPEIRTERRFATYHVLGEKSALRKIDINSPKDIDDMWDIEQSKGMRKWIIQEESDLCVTKEELKDWVREKSHDDVDQKLRHKRSYVKVYAVTKSDCFPGEQHGEGWTPLRDGLGLTLRLQLQVKTKRDVDMKGLWKQLYQEQKTIHLLWN